MGNLHGNSGVVCGIELGYYYYLYMGAKFEVTKLI